MILALLLLSAAAHAQDIKCFSHADVVSGLEKEFGEKKALSILSGKGTLYELFVSKNETWTLVENYPDGRACPVMSGEGVQFESIFYGWET